MSEQLSGMDAAFLSLETPESPMHVVGVLLLDGAAGDGFTTERLRQVLADRLHLIPPFCRRLVDVPLSLDKPYWHYDNDVDLDRHVFDLTLDPPGDRRALGALVGRIAGERLDRSIPLWQLHLVDGLADGRVALVAKVHHSTLYGVAGAEFIGELLDLTPEVGARPAAPETEPVTEPGALTLAGRTVRTHATFPLTVGRLAVRVARGGAGRMRALGGAVTRHGRGALPAAAPRSLISGAPTVRRQAAFGALPLEVVRETRTAAGVTVNDIVLAAVALAVGRYLQRRDALPSRPLVAGVPVNAGEGSTSGTNSLATMTVALPVDIVSPADLIAAVSRNSAAAKAFTAAVGAGAVAELADLTTPALLSTVTWLTRNLGLATLTPTMFNLVVSNVVGPPIPLYLAGAAVEAIFPMGPLLAGAGMNLTVLSNVDRLDVGIMACPDLVDDVWELVDSLPACLAELHAAVTVGEQPA